MEREMDFPPITVVVTTYFPEGENGKLRRAVLENTFHSWRECLGYVGGINIHIADDGSSPELLNFAWDWFRGYQYPVTITTSSQQRKGVGASLNAGFRQAFLTSPLVFYAVDDWELQWGFDLTPWAQLLLEREGIGMVRLGPPHPNIRGSVEAFTDNIQSWGLRLERYGFAFGHRPALYHKRMIDSYGWFAEDMNALETERLYNEHFQATPGPDIVLALPSAFQHLDSVELAYLEPNANKEEDEEDDRD